MGEAEIDEHLNASFVMCSLNFPNKLEFNAQETGREWELIPFPKHTIMINTDGSDLSGLESALAFRDVLSENEGETVPECIAYYTTLDEDGSPSSFSLYEFVNMARGVEWCAGFIIPLDVYNPDEHIKLMTDDFLIIDIEGFPLDVPIKATRGAILNIPIRVANLKAKGDRGGAIFWGWDGTDEEGRINFGDIPYKGIIKMPDLEIPVPKKTGEYRLRLLLIDFDGVVQAFNHLDVVVG